VLPVHSQFTLKARLIDEILIRYYNDKSEVGYFLLAYPVLGLLKLNCHMSSFHNDVIMKLRNHAKYRTPY